MEDGIPTNESIQARQSLCWESVFGMANSPWAGACCVPVCSGLEEIEGNRWTSGRGAGRVGEGQCVNVGQHSKVVMSAHCLKSVPTLISPEMLLGRETTTNKEKKSK